MRIPPRRGRPASSRSTETRDRARRRFASSVESLEGRQLLAPVGPVPIGPPPSPTTVQVPPGPAADGPRVAFVQFEPLTGRVQVSFTGDVAGINPRALADPASYSFTALSVKGKGPVGHPSRPSAGVVLAPDYVVTGVTLAPDLRPGASRSVTLSINNNQPMRDGFYRFRILSNAIVDDAGRPLDGAYTGTFPTGNGRPSSDFVATLAVVRNSVQPALPVASTPTPPAQGPGRVKPTPIFYPATRPVETRYVGNNNPNTRLMGGVNVKVVALPGQDFPGTFTLPATVGGHAIRPVAHPSRKLR